MGIKLEEEQQDTFLLWNALNLVGNHVCYTSLGERLPNFFWLMTFKRCRWKTLWIQWMEAFEVRHICFFWGIQSCKLIGNGTRYLNISLFFIKHNLTRYISHFYWDSLCLEFVMAIMKWSYCWLMLIQSQLFKLDKKSQFPFMTAMIMTCLCWICWFSNI